MTHAWSSVEKELAMSVSTTQRRPAKNSLKSICSAQLTCT